MRDARGGTLPPPPPSDAVEATRRLVAIPSVNPVLEPGGAGEGEMARVTADWLRAWGWKVRVQEVAEGRFNVSAVRGTEGPGLLLNGHLDTVGIDGMTVDPFGADSTADRIVGRGSCDMKSGLAVILETARRAALEDWPGRLHILLTADEEHASLGMEAAVRDGAPEVEAAIVTEPTSLAVMPAHKGFAWVRASFLGRAAHGSRPEVGIDAARAAARFVAALDGLDRELREREPHPLLGFGSWHVGTLRSGVAPSVYPARAELVLERRTLPDEDGSAFEAELRRYLAGVPEIRPGLEDGGRPDDATRGQVRATLETELVRPGSDVPPDHPLVTGLLAAARSEGVDRPVEGMTAWVDAAWLNQAGVPAICFGPGSIEQAHTTDEWVATEEIRAAAGILARFTRDWLGRG